MSNPNWVTQKSRLLVRAVTMSSGTRGFRINMRILGVPLLNALRPAMTWHSDCPAQNRDDTPHAEPLPNDGPAPASTLAEIPAAGRTGHSRAHRKTWSR